MVTEEKVEEAPEDNNKVTPEPKEATELKQDEVQENEEVEEKSADAEKDSLIALVQLGFIKRIVPKKKVPKKKVPKKKFRKKSSEKKSSEKTVSVPVPIVPAVTILHGSKSRSNQTFFYMKNLSNNYG